MSSPSSSSHSPAHEPVLGGALGSSSGSSGGSAGTSLVLTAGRRGSTGLVMDSGRHALHGPYTPTGPSGRRIHTPTSLFAASSPTAAAARAAPMLNTCRCLNIACTFSVEPALTEGEAKALENLFGSADGHSHAAAGGPLSSPPLFPDGYLPARSIVFHSRQQEGLTASRPHPLQSAWTIKRCLSCHLDVWAESRSHMLAVINARLYVESEGRQWRATDLFSKHFGILIRAAPGSISTSPHSAEMVSALATSGSPPNALLQGQPSLFHLKQSLDQCLEAERISLEARLSQQRAVEEQRFAEVENRIRREFATLLVNLEREVESGPLADGASPRHGFDASRRHSMHRLFQTHVRKGSSTNSQELYGLGDGSSSTGEDGATNEATMSPTRVVDLMAAQSRGISPSTSNPSLSRTSSHSSNRGTPTLGTSSDDRAAASAAATADKNVVAVPLDLHRDAPASGPRLSLSSGQAPAGAAKKNLPAPPILAPPSPTARMDPLQLDGHEGPSTGEGGISLVPYVDDEPRNSAAREQLLESLTDFDDFVLPVGHAATASAADAAAEGLESARQRGSSEEDTIFDLDEEQERSSRHQQEAPLLSPAALSELGRGHSGDSGDEEDEEEDGEEAELSDEELQPAAISSKAAKLLGMAADPNGTPRRSHGGSVSSQTGGGGVTGPSAFPSSIIRPRTSSGSGGGISMVPMSLPIQIPAPFKQMVEATKEGGVGTQQQQAARESGLGRSLKQAAQAGSLRAAPTVAPPRISSAYSSSDESGDEADDDGGGRTRASRADGAFVPPHTLVDESFLSRSRVPLQGSVPGQRRVAPDAAGAASASAAAAAARAMPSQGTPPPPLPSTAFTLPSPYTPLASSVPRVVGALGSARIVQPSGAGAGAGAGATAAAPASGPAPVTASSSSTPGKTLGFVPATVPPVQKAANPARGSMPSSRNPGTQQQPR